ncbi:MAG: PD-(D/E)XK nuclease family protein [Treponema sp.]|nr:PD-(D/E)XK nuclease family protein [Treponema sp.]
MQITNKMGLPQTLVNACETEKHNKPGEISATTLLKGAKAVVLTDRHWEDLTADVTELAYSIEGTAFHKFLEMKNPDAFTEERFSVQIQDKVVTGQVDLYDMENGIIFDYKRTSVWKSVYKNYEDWRKQGLIYAYLMRQNGLTVNKCVFVMLFRDWSKTESLKNADYPKAPIQTVEFDVTDEALEEIEAYIRQKVAEISKAETMADDEIEPCSEEERWARPTIYAVMKKGRKTAVNAKLTNKAEAEAMAATIDGGYVEERKGVSAKCEGYCSCCDFCKFYKENCQNGGEDNGENAA